MELIQSITRLKRPDLEQHLAVSEAIKHLNQRPSIEGHVNNDNFLFDLYRKTEIGAETSESVSKCFFSHAAATGEKLTNGVIETPAYIADFIVQMAVETYQSNSLADLSHNQIVNLEWHDPCVGAGVFPLAILRLYRKVLGTPFSNVNQLPIIDFNDISEIGVFLTLCAIESHLRVTGITVQDYLVSKRLSFSVFDELQNRGETLDILTGALKSFHIVVGNPPYVRSTRIGEDSRLRLRKLFPSTYYGNADLYTYFIASGISSLRKDGVLAFISPASFLRSRSGLQIRRYITKTSSLCRFVDLDETPVFADASVHSAIYVLKKGATTDSQILYALATNESDLEKLRNGTFALISANAILSDVHGWSFHRTVAQHRRFDRLFSKCAPLSRFDIRVYSGIRPGVTKAFVLSADEVKSFPAHLKKEWLRQLVLPANILRWRGAKDIHYLVFTPFGCETPPVDLLNHLIKFKDLLINRPETHSPEDWYKLRTCSYYDRMNNKKIAFPDISASQRFSLIDPGVLVLDGSYFIDSDDLALLGILNSKLAKEYFMNRCSSVGSLKSKGRFRFKKTYLQDFPLPEWFSEISPLKKQLIDTVQLIITSGESERRTEALNKLVSQFYISPR